MLAWLHVFRTYNRLISSLTSQVGRRNLCLIQWNDHTKHSYSDTANDSTGEKVGWILRSRLETSTDCEDDDGREHSVLPRNRISQISVEQSASPSAQFQRSNKPTLDGRASQRWKVRLKILHNQNWAHDSLIIAVHHAAERCKAACHEHVRVLQKAAEAMLQVCVVLSYQ